MKLNTCALSLSLSRYVGNLDTSVSEDLVCALFSQIGPVKGCKIIREVRELYALIVSL